MKKSHISLILLSMLMIFGACDEKEDLIFEHEKPQFEIQLDKILIETLVPQSTVSGDEIYIVGDFNGGNSAFGDEKYKLEVSGNTVYRWGVYLDPDDFIDGKTLSDGYWFVSANSGIEKMTACNDTIHTASVSTGSRLETSIANWKSECAVDETDSEWPEVETGKIMLKLELPEYTPEDATILLFGGVNGWDGSDESLWKTTAISNTKHYILLDPDNFADGTSLTDQFKFALIIDGQEWWYHQSNEDGTTADGAGYYIDGALPGSSYDITVEEWRAKNELPKEWPAVEDGKIMLRITVPDYTPEGATILLYGGINGWDGSDETKWKTTELEAGKHYLMLDPSDFVDGTSLVDEFKFGLIIDGYDWWYFQNNEDGTDTEISGFSIANASAGNYYELEILGWARSAEL